MKITISLFLIVLACIVLVYATPSSEVYASVSFFSRFDSASGLWIPDFVNGNGTSKAVAVPKRAVLNGNVAEAMFCFVGTWVMYSGTNYSGSALLFRYTPTSQLTSCHLMGLGEMPNFSFPITISSYLPLGNVTDIKAKSITFFENAQYCGKIITSVTSSETFKGGMSVGSCIMTGTYAWCLEWTIAGQQPRKSTIGANDCERNIWSGIVLLSNSANACS